MPDKYYLNKGNQDKNKQEEPFVDGKYRQARLKVPKAIPEQLLNNIRIESTKENELEGFTKEIETTWQSTTKKHHSDRTYEHYTLYIEIPNVTGVTHTIIIKDWNGKEKKKKHFITWRAIYLNVNSENQRLYYLYNAAIKVVIQKFKSVFIDILRNNEQITTTNDSKKTGMNKDKLKRRKCSSIDITLKPAQWDPFTHTYVLKVDNNTFTGEQTTRWSLENNELKYDITDGKIRPENNHPQQGRIEFVKELKIEDASGGGEQVQTLTNYANDDILKQICKCINDTTVIPDDHLKDNTTHITVNLAHEIFNPYNSRYTIHIKMGLTEYNREMGGALGKQNINLNISDAWTSDTLARTLVHELAHILNLVQPKTTKTDGTEHIWSNLHSSDDGGAGTHCKSHAKECEDNNTKSHKNYVYNNDSTGEKLCIMYYRDDPNRGDTFCEDCLKQLRLTTF